MKILEEKIISPKNKKLKFKVKKEASKKQLEHALKKQAVSESKLLLVQEEWEGVLPKSSRLLVIKLVL